jgi:hypothetical protein
MAMVMVSGDVTLNMNAKRDCVQGPTLLNRLEDRNNITSHFLRNNVTRHLLGYESSYTTPHDPFRWAIIRDAVDNVSLDIIGVTDTTMFDVLDTTSGTGKVRSINLALLNAGGITLSRQGSQTASGLFSPDPKRDKIIYVSPTALNPSTTNGTSSLPHELFGHWFLDRKGAPSRHGDVITLAHKIVDPIGEPYSGPAASPHGQAAQLLGNPPGFVELYAANAGAPANLPLSPTMHVEPPRAGNWLDKKLAEFNRLLGPEMSKSGVFGDDFTFAWISLSNNHEISMLAFVRSSRTKKVYDVVTPVFAAYKQLNAQQKARFESFLFTMKTGGTGHFGLGLSTRLGDDTQTQIAAQKSTSAVP